MRIAVIDLGTNTCNLLVAEIISSGFEILHQSKQLVKLGDAKIKTNEISDEAIKRVLRAFQANNDVIKNFNADVTKVIATSAIRTAVNKDKFLKEILFETGLKVEVVSGEREAELIFQGVLLAFENLVQPSVILDIGGGSNELILAHGKEILWKESRPTGMGRVINSFSISDPIKEIEINQLKSFFSKEHTDGFNACKDRDTHALIGCSGAFDTVADLIDQVEPGEKVRTTQEIPFADFYTIYNKLISSTRAERLKMKGMDMVRIDLIIPAVILIEQLISKIGIRRIIQTDFALREGVLYEKINNL